MIEEIERLANSMEILARELKEAQGLPPQEAIKVLLGDKIMENSTKNEKFIAPHVCSGCDNELVAEENTSECSSCSK